MGLSLGQGGQGGSGGSGTGEDVSFYRKQEEREARERQAFLKSDAPPPTVGLISKVLLSLLLVSLSSLWCGLVARTVSAGRQCFSGFGGLDQGPCLGDLQAFSRGRLLSRGCNSCLDGPRGGECNP